MKSLKVCAFAVIATLATASSGHAADEVSKGDKEFLKNASEMGLAEVELGKLAQSKGTSPDVKALGKKLVTDHTKSNNELKALAKKKNVELDWNTTAAQKSAADAFEKKSGADFDKEFREQTAKSHEKAIKLFEEAAKDAKDPEVKAFAAKHLPGLKKHHEMAAGHAHKEKK